MKKIIILVYFITSFNLISQVSISPKILWERTYLTGKTNPNDQVILPLTVQETFDKSLLIKAYRFDINSAILKINSNGDKIWLSTIGDSSMTPIYPISINFNRTDNNIKFRGLWTGFGSGGVFSLGSINYLNGDTSNFYLKKGKDDFNKTLPLVCNTKENGLFLSFNSGGYKSPSDSGKKFYYFRKLDEKDSLVWRDSLSFPDSVQSGSGIVIRTNDDGYLFTSVLLYPTISRRLIMVKYNSSLKLDWVKYYDNYENVKGLVQTPDGGYVICVVNSEGSIMPKQPVSYLLKFDSKGEKSWQKSFSLDDFTDLRSLHFLNNKLGFVISGTLAKKGVWNNGPPNLGRYYLYGSKKFLLMTTDLLGNITSTNIWQPDTLDCNPSDAIQTSDGNFVVVGEKVKSTYTTTQDNLPFGYVAKIENQISEVQNENKQNNIKSEISGNKLKIIFTSLEKPIKINLYDLNGKSLFERTLSNNQKKIDIDLSNFVTGYYFINLIYENHKIETKKIIYEK
jgi:hypothetical protein